MSKRHTDQAEPGMSGDKKMSEYRVISNKNVNVIIATCKAREEAEQVIARNDLDAHFKYMSDSDLKQEAFEERKLNREEAINFGLEVNDRW